MYTNPISGIYKILNNINGKIYVGSSNDIYGRWASHKSLLSRNEHTSTHLQNAWNSHGESAFEFSILEKVEEINLIEREQHWLDLHKSYDQTIGYNILQKAKSNVGYKHTDETKTSISAKMTGRKLSNKTIQKFKLRDLSYLRKPEVVAKSAAAKRGRLTSEESKVKQSESMKKAYAEGKRKAWQTGKTMSAETKLKISEANRDRKLSEEHKQNLRKPHKKYTPRKKI